jgi:RNA polymerase sigma factor (sigma-70 family)
VGATRQHETELVRRLQRLPAHCEEARELEAQLSLSISNVVVRAAVEMARRTGLDAEDLVQEGLIATMRCWQGFRLTRGSGHYAAYALQVATRAMAHHADSMGALVHIPTRTQRRARQAQRMARKGVPMAEALRECKLSGDAMAAVSARPVRHEVDVLLQMPALSPDAASQYSQREGWLRVQAALEQLPRAQRQVLLASFGFGRAEEAAAEDRTLAAEMRTTDSAVRSMREAALCRLRAILGDDECPSS